MRLHLDVFFRVAADVSLVVAVEGLAYTVLVAVLHGMPHVAIAAAASIPALYAVWRLMIGSGWHARFLFSVLYMAACTSAYSLQMVAYLVAPSECLAMLAAATAVTAPLPAVASLVDALHGTGVTRSKRSWETRSATR